MKINKSLPVLVTGATGYIAGWVVKDLLDEGITVHAPIRDTDNTQKREHLDKLAENSSGKIKYFESDLMIEDSYKEAMKGCELVIHTASPFVMDSKDPQKEVIEPALKGTQNVLKTVNETESVKRVVLTSSVAAIYGNGIDGQSVEGGLFNESMWNTTSTSTDGEYSYSKTVAEKEAWKICEEQKRWDLVVINPGFVLGPSLNPNALFESKKFMLQMGNGDLKSGAPDITMGMVDVRDVSKAHVIAGFSETAKGRHILSAGTHTLLETGGFIKEKFGDKYPVPTRNAPKFLIWILAPFIGIKRNFVSKNVGYKIDFDNRKSIKELGINYSPVKKAVVDFFQQFIDNGLV
jgi:nucleoside-diphosphate-sugar epimerase